MTDEPPKPSPFLAWVSEHPQEAVTLINAVGESVAKVILTIMETEEHREARRSKTGKGLIYTILAILGGVAVLATIAASYRIISGEGLAFVYGAIIGALIPFAQYEVAPLFYKEETGG